MEDTNVLKVIGDEDVTAILYSEARDEYYVAAKGKARIIPGDDWRLMMMKQALEFLQNLP